jgi:hypothetical protein
VAKGVYVSHRSQGVEKPEALSRLALYALARATHRMMPFDTGTYIRAAFQVLNALGFAPESEWPYDTGRFAQMPPTAVFRAGFDTSEKPARYYRIFEQGDARCDAVKQAIANGHGVVFGADVGRKFTSNSFDPTKPTDPRAGERAGGHAMLLVAYDAEGVTLINSWGLGWGASGFCKVSWEFIANGMRDVWVVEHAPLHQEDIYDELD